MPELLLDQIRRDIHPVKLCTHKATEAVIAHAPLAGVDQVHAGEPGIQLECVERHVAERRIFRVSPVKLPLEPFPVHVGYHQLTLA